MKKFGDLPVYFMILGLILNIIMFFYNEVSFTNLMIRSSIVIILFAVMGYFLAYVLREAHTALAISTKQNKAKNEAKENNGSKIDIRVNSEDDDELFKLIPKSEDEEFTEISVDNFKKFMDQDSN
ncbi:MAG: hypothetical protein K0R80_3382 [Clostridia bacterium]|jgi:hypothetical protein|nr:hypothetical protein [Clostridia bacterium]